MTPIYAPMIPVPASGYCQDKSGPIVAGEGRWNKFEEIPRSMDVGLGLLV